MKQIKILSVLTMAVMLTNCASIYNIKSEKGNVVDKVPQWYMADINDSKVCDKKIFGKDKDKVCIYGVETAVSPDLNLAIEKGKNALQNELADIIKGEMNKKSSQFITELGKTETKTIVSEVESVLVNIIKDTKVRGYEIFEQDVLNKECYYRGWIGLRLPMGEFNKMYNYTIEEAVDAYNLKIRQMLPTRT